MNKAVLLMEDMPERCVTCEISTVDLDFCGEFYCPVMEHWTPAGKECRPADCPLIYLDDLEKELF